MSWSLDQWAEVLREQHRIKRGVDYAVAHKYGELRVYCNELFRDTIVETARERGMTITSVETWRDHETL